MSKNFPEKSYSDPRVSESLVRFLNTGGTFHIALRNIGVSILRLLAYLPCNRMFLSSTAQKKKKKEEEKLEFQFPLKSPSPGAYLHYVNAKTSKKNK